jgi:hypothetical protein
MAKKMSKEDLQDWESLYEYVKQLMNYDENQALSKYMILRLKGLLTSKFIENKNIKDNSNYSYKVILATFKYCSPSILNALRVNNFKDENHKINYILKIVERNINDVYLKIRNSERAKEEARSVTVETTIYQGAKFKPKKQKDDRFSDLW